MFGFGNKKNREIKSEDKKEEELSYKRKEELLKVIAFEKEQITKIDIDEQAKGYEKIGLSYNELGDYDEAMAALEKSLNIKKSVGDGYKTLLRLYNKKRAKAAKENDEDKLQIYLKKIDEMMQISKDVTRGVK